MVLGQANTGITKQSFHTFGRPQITRCAVGDLHIALGRLQAFLTVTAEQACRRMAAHHSRQFPSQVVGVRDACVATTRPKRTHHFGRVANEKHPLVLQLMQAL